MRTFTLLKDMPVFSPNGVLIGEVKDITIADDGKVKKILVKGKGFFSKVYGIPISKVKTFGQHGIILHQEKPLLSKYKEANNEYTMYHSHPIAKNFAFSDAGEQLGLLDDVYFMEEVGTIVGYELTDGFFSEMMEGKRVIHSVHPPKIGKDAIIVKVN